MYKTRFRPELYDPTTCMSFKNREEIDKFCIYLDSIGKRWSSGNRYTTCNYFDRHRESTVYYFNKGTYGRLEHVKEETVLRYDDFYYNEDDVPPELDITFDQLINQDTTTV